jgi:hypothetical protein
VYTQLGVPALVTGRDGSLSSVNEPRGCALQQSGKLATGKTGALATRAAKYGHG